jgi:hypothetical protein
MAKCLTSLQTNIFRLVQQQSLSKYLLLMFAISVSTTAGAISTKRLDCMTNNAAPTFITLTQMENSNFELSLQLNNDPIIEDTGAKLSEEILSGVGLPRDIIYTTMKMQFTSDQCNLYPNKTISCAGNPKIFTINGVATTRIENFNLAVIRNLRSFPGGNLLEQEAWDISMNLRISMAAFPKTVSSNYLSNSNSSVLSCRVNVN